MLNLTEQEPKRRLSRRAFVSAAAGIVVVAAAAGGVYYLSRPAPGPAPTPSSATPIPTITATSPSASLTALYGGTVRISHMVDNHNLDPRLATGLDDIYVNRLVFDTLYKYVKNETGEMAIVPVLAKDTVKMIDEKTAEIAITEGVTFHDGSPLTADDVIYTLDSMAGKIPDFVAPLGSLYTFIDSNEKVDDYTVRVHFKQAHSPFLPKLTGLSIISKAAAEKLGKDYNVKPVGSGPFKFVDWVPGERVTLSKNNEYFVKGVPYLDGVAWPFVPELSTAVARLSTGEIDVAQPLPYTAVGSLLKNPGVDVNIVEGSDATWFMINNLKPYFADKRVRQALLYATDKQTLVDKVLYGYGYVSINPFPRWFWAYNPNSQTYPYNPDKARQLLKDAGYPNGFECELMCSNVSKFEDQATIMKDNLKQVGITANLRPGEEESSYSYVFDGTYDLFLTRGNTFALGLDPDVECRWDWYLDTPGDPGTLKGTVKGEMYNYYMFWHGPAALESAKLIDQAATTYDQQERKALYFKWQEIILEEVPTCVLNFADVLSANQKYVKKYWQDYSSVSHLEDTYIQK